ncbi:flavonol sulfotransferase-like [Chenopodium quinoa]|uniref:flavonol sulfotransferase-like n=1 Tax=Chenopodium quinoa TaxID=63459 RepID=UPI000B787149|nr:flavonol sulfotransferase-like [Chenopodium quinoa]
MSEIQKEEIYVKKEEVEKLMEYLPKAKLRTSQKFHMVLYEDFWYFVNNSSFRNVLTFQKHFVARDSDIFITSLPKTGSTWLKSLLFMIVNRANYPIDQSPLLTHHPQELVYSLETDVYNKAFDYPQPHHLSELPSPRLLSTHVPYTSLPESIRNSGCRILYICRNPLDTIVSKYHFVVDGMKHVENFVKPSLEDFFEDFCDGKVAYGPFFDHVLGFWKMSLEHPDKVLFLKYEDLKDNPVNHLKRLAEFIGMPFSTREENEGVIQQVIEFCSIKNMKELDVNKSGVINNMFEKKSYFRKGEVGDWTNHFTPSMVERVNKLMEEKLEGSGLSFKLLPPN